MKPSLAAIFSPKGRLVLAAILFFGWVGYLAYLAGVSGLLPGTRVPGHPIILSRPQFLASTLDVIADVQQDGQGNPDAKVRIVEVHWPPAQQHLAGAEVLVKNLLLLEKEHGWEGAGRYILPLTSDGADYQVARVPHSPGYEPPRNRPRIYRLNPQTRRQLESIAKP